MFKKIIYGLAISSVLFACQDESNTIELQESLDQELITSHLMSFNSQDDYKKIFEDPTIIENKTNELNFVSLKSKMPDLDLTETDTRNTNNLKNTADFIYDDYGILPKILNEDKIVKIDSYLIKVDLHNERVLVLEDQYQEEYDDLVFDNLKNNNIMVFSTEDEILQLLNQGSRGTINAQRACDSGANHRTIDRQWKSSRRKRGNGKVAFQKAGIYFSLVADIHAQKRSLGIWFRDGGASTSITYNVWWQGRCDGHSDGAENGSVSNSGGRTVYRPYESFDGLHLYRYEADLYSSNGSGGIVIEDVTP
ncbi:hypothetical protein [uncultured Dokdonia sp.]|uniref:hypothetical protein n=1 Tax=uncultured Dokdonia sp. TaxID=575653 RepID=UPI00262A4A7A|nr:hypothetical protein [uncultured Dokdonia sp.]